MRIYVKKKKKQNKGLKKMKLRKGSENWRNTWGWSGEKQVEDEELALGVDLSNAKIHVINLYKNPVPWVIMVWWKQ